MEGELMNELVNGRMDQYKWTDRQMMDRFVRGACTGEWINWCSNPISNITVAFCSRDAVPRVCVLGVFSPLENHCILTNLFFFPLQRQTSDYAANLSLQAGGRRRVSEDVRLNTQRKAFAVSTQTTQMEEGFVIIEQRNKSLEKTATHIFLITLFLTDMLAHFCIILPAEAFWIFWAFFLIF